MPSFDRSLITAVKKSTDSKKGLMSKIWLPMWQSNPMGLRASESRAIMYKRRAVDASTPNLFSLSPVEIYGWVPASTSGLMRIDTGAVFPSSPAISANCLSSDSDSILKQRIPLSNASASSERVFPTPENTTFPASPPARITLSSSPPIRHQILRRVGPSDSIWQDWSWPLPRSR